MRAAPADLLMRGPSLSSRRFLDGVGEQHRVDALLQRADGGAAAQSGGRLFSSAFTWPGCGDSSRMRLPILIASGIECVTNSTVNRVSSQSAATRPASCAASAHRAPRTARPSAGCRAPSPCRARSRRAASCRPTACAGSCRRTRTDSLSRCSRAPSPRRPCAAAAARLQREHDVSLTVFQGRSWSNSWNTIMRSGPGCFTASPFSRISPSTGCM